ncbi:MAG TPA: PQQ-binding-like beta-propeller repeat protein [Planctomycetota bacterium]
MLYLLLLALGDDTGWRGDGTGRYPAAAPPTSWGRVSEPLRGLRFQANAPKAGAVGAAMADGVIREWLVLGPAPEGVKVDKEVLPGEAGLAPSENEKLGDAVWKKVRFDTAWMNFHAILDRPGIACAATNVYAETAGSFRLLATTPGGFRLLLNGKPLPTGYGRYSLDLVKGWNRLLLKVSAQDKNWACSFALHAKAPATFDQSNIAWSVPLPGVQGGFYGGGMGCGSLVHSSDRIYLLSEPHDLICLRKSDGKILWIRTNSFFDAATDEDRKSPAYAEAEAIARKLDAVNAAGRMGEKAALEKALSAKMAEVDPVRYKVQETPDVGFSGFTPIRDGERLYVWLGNGVTAAYDLDGVRAWIRADPLPAVEHGFSSSPLLVDGKIVVFMRDLFAFDAATGRLAWRIPVVAHTGANPGGFFHGTPVRVARGGVALIVLGNGTVVRASDGQILYTTPDLGNQAISSPVVDGDRLLQTSTGSMKLYVHALPDAVTGPFKMETRTVPVGSPHPYYYMPWHMASPLVHDGLAYLLNNSGVLTVADLKEARVLYQALVDLDQFQTSNEGAARGVGISPTLAGKHIYLFGNNGGAVVIEPGRTYKPVAKNKIESLVSVGHWGERQERFVSNPVFDGDRLYLRGEGHLYAIASGAAASRSTTAREAPVPRPAAPAPATPLAAPVVEADVIPPSVFGWRRNGTGVFPDVDPPTEWSETQNVKWRARVGGGHSSPVLAGGRVFVVSEPGTLAALDRNDGKTAWKVDLGFQRRPNAPAESKEYARATPVTDGRTVFVASANGIVAAYTVDGALRWTREVEPARLTYGASASPVLAGDKLLVDGRRLRALDAETGRVVWTAAEGESHYGTPALASIDGLRVAVTAKGTVIRVADGAVLATEIAAGLGGDQAPSPLVRGGVVYFTYKRCSAVKLTRAGDGIRVEKLWERELPGDIIASPLLKDGMLFVVPSGAGDYRVLNAATGDVLLEKELDLAPDLQPSLALAGKRLFLGNDQGDTLVLDPAREYRELRRNSLPEGSGASPVFSGAHLFLRGGETLYCVGP